MAKKMTIETLIEACTAARARFEKSEVEYLEFLSGVEANHEDLWKSADATFVQFITRRLGKPEPVRWSLYKRALAEVGAEEIRRVGLDGAAAIMSVRPENRTTLQRDIHAWSEEHGGVHPSAHYARDLARNVEPRAITPLPTRRAAELEQLRAENRELRAENGRLKKRIAQLESRQSVAAAE